MTKEERRQEALNEIREHIAEYGFHTYVVTGGGDPHFGYTIGLTESLGAELILPGTYFYKLADVSKVIKSIIGKLAPPVPWDVSVDAPPWGTFSFRHVHMSWATALMLGAFDYYQGRNIEAYQIVPDEGHWTIDVPDLSQPWSPNAAPGWRWLKEEWKYPVPRDSMALTDLTVLRGGRIAEVMRWEEDQWEIFSGPDIPESERRAIPLGVLLDADESLRPAVDLRVEAGFWRDKGETEWHPWGKAKDSEGT
jgi:Domain of unknown function (DUF4262)